MITRAKHLVSVSPACKSAWAAALLAAIFLTSCGFQQYVAKPLDPLAAKAKFAEKDSNSEQFSQYLLRNGYTADRLPIQQWGLDELTYCALFFHPSLDVARAQWRAAQFAEMSAAEQAMPTVTGSIAHSNDPDPAKKPFAIGLSIDIPIETANKRGIRMENAQHLTQVAKLEIAQTAWQLRADIAQSLTAYQFNLQQIQLFTLEETRRQEIVAMYQKRVNLGVASNIELSAANLQLQSATSALNAKKQDSALLLSKLASNVGLPLSKIQKMTLLTSKPRSESMSNGAHLETLALLNRLDIRIALERYAAAEAKLKLEIAKQYPDLAISPGYAFEFGDKVWSLGLSGLMMLLNKNKIGIAEANQLREVEAAQFENLQAQVIAETDKANAELMQAQLALANQQKLLAQQQGYTARMTHKFAAGEIDRLALAFVKLEQIAAEKNLAEADFQLKSALNQLENTLQKPLSETGLELENGGEK